jgi:transcriptional regulator with XRE-family HTH domain
MSYTLEYITDALQIARKGKKLSQRALSAKINVPQSHISKIESGVVDLQTSSLIEIARALDLELMLIPRSLVPTVKSLSRGAVHDGEDVVPAYRLGED